MHYARRVGSDGEPVPEPHGSRPTIPQKLIESAFAYLDLGDYHPELYQLMFIQASMHHQTWKQLKMDPNFMCLRNDPECVDSGEFIGRRSYCA